eukprot:1985617-Pyramimonas_sp.AAC.1
MLAPACCCNGARGRLLRLRAHRGRDFGGLAGAGDCVPQALRDGAHRHPVSREVARQPSGPFGI